MVIVQIFKFKLVYLFAGSTEVYEMHLYLAYFSFVLFANSVCKLLFVNAFFLYCLQ